MGNEKYVLKLVTLAEIWYMRSVSSSFRIIVLYIHSNDFEGLQEIGDQTVPQ